MRERVKAQVDKLLARFGSRAQGPRPGTSRAKKGCVQDLATTRASPTGEPELSSSQSAGSRKAEASMKILTRMGDSSTVEMTRGRAAPRPRGGHPRRPPPRPRSLRSPRTRSTNLDECSPAPAASGASSAGARGGHDEGRVPSTPELGRACRAASWRRSTARWACASSSRCWASTRWRFSHNPTTRSSRSAFSRRIEQAPHGAPPGDDDLSAAVRLHANLGLYYRPDGSFSEPVRPAAAGQDRRGPQDPGRGPAGLPGRLHPDE